MAAAFIGVAAGAYLLLLVASPEIGLHFAKQNLAQSVPKEATALTERRLYVPRLGLNLPYGDTERALDDGLWHRSPERGNPEIGGNFILAAHRFQLALTPAETNRKSPLYHIDKMKIGDYIYADFNGKRYQYEISNIFRVTPTQVEIEAPSEQPKLTLYTCTLGGTSDGREVLEARLVEGDIDPSAALLVSSQEM